MPQVARTNRRVSERRRRHELLVDAAERVFAAKGIGNATVDDVAAEAEYSKGLLYKHFRSKEEIYQAICLRGFQLMLRRFETAVKDNGTGKEQLVAIGESYIAIARRHPLYFEAHVFHASQAPDPDSTSIAAQAEKVGDQILRLVMTTIETGMEDGSIKRSVDPRQTAFILWSTMLGMVVTATFRKSLARFELEDDAFLAASLKFVTDAIG
jgi:AcrR family transcriptional regulator